MDEAKLIRRAKRGDADAFNTLMSTYQHRLFAVCLRIMDNHSDAEDCLQDCMLRVFRSISSFKGDSSLFTWLYRVATTTCLDELRRRKRRTSVSLDILMENGWSPMESPDLGPEYTLLSKNKQHELIKLLKELPDEMRDPVVYRDVMGFSYDEIAELTGSNIGTVKSRISRGRQKLREKISANPELFDKSIV